MNQVYSRRSPQTGSAHGPRMSMCSRSSRMYCWSFFQLSSRLVITSRIKPSRSVCARTAPGAATNAARAAAETRWHQRIRCKTKFNVRWFAQKQKGLEHVARDSSSRGDDLEQIRHRKHAAIAPAFLHDQQVIDPVLLHEPEAIGNRPIGGDRHQARAHDFGDPHPGGTLVLGGNFVRDVALGNHPDEGAVGGQDADSSGPAARADSAPRRGRSGRRGWSRPRRANRSSRARSSPPPRPRLRGRLPADWLACELCVEPRRQRREVIQDGAGVHLLRPGQRIERVRATDATGP